MNSKKENCITRNDSLQPYSKFYDLCGRYKAIKLQSCYISFNNYEMVFANTRRDTNKIFITHQFSNIKFIITIFNFTTLLFGSLLIYFRTSNKHERFSSCFFGNSFVFFFALYHFKVAFALFEVTVR